MAPTSSIISDVDIIEDKAIPSLLNHRIDYGRYLLEKRLGSGGYSVVYLATDLAIPERPKITGLGENQTEFFLLNSEPRLFKLDSTSRKYAVKCLLHRTASQKLKNAREVQIHRRLSTFMRNGIVQFHHTVEEDGMLFIILDYCERGDLFSAITSKKLFIGDDELIKASFLQLLDAVMDCHSLGIYHRDLKPENILLTSMSGGRISLQLTDFGMATEDDRTSDFGCGSYYYMSPECITGYMHNGINAYSSRSADIWALGIILINMVFSRLPWKSAVLSDPSFRRYMRNPRWLRHMLPLSEEAFQFVDHIFSTHGNTKPLSQLRKDFLKIETFYMTEDELDAAHKSARLVANDLIKEVRAEVHAPEITDEDIGGMTNMDDIDERELFVEEDTEPTLRRDDQPSSTFSDCSSIEDWVTAPSQQTSELSVGSASPALVSSDTIELSRLEAQLFSTERSHSVPEITLRQVALDMEADSEEVSPTSTACASPSQNFRAVPKEPTVSPSSSTGHGTGELTGSGSLSSSGSASPFPITPETRAVPAVGEVADFSLGGGQYKWTPAQPKRRNWMDLSKLDKALAAVQDDGDADSESSEV